MKTSFKRLMWETEAAEGDRTHMWAQICAMAGAEVWAGMAVLARMGIARIGGIELLFLFATLVIVPLGMELGRMLEGGNRVAELAGRVQPAGAACAVAAMWFPPGRSAGLFACAWLCVCLVAAWDGVRKLVSFAWRDAGVGTRATQAWHVDGDAGRSARATVSVTVTMAIAGIDLAVGGAWFVASRLGMRPMGIQEPIGLLTAVHFQFAGFATAMIGAAMLRFAERRGEYRWLKWLVLAVTGLPYVVAMGFVISPVLKMAAATGFSLSVAGLAICLRNLGKSAGNGTARLLLQTASGAVFAGMVLAGMYAVMDYLGNGALTIPQMARTHGILNAVGFCLPGLLGWLVEND